MRENISPVGHSWEEVRREIFTPGEIALCDYQVALTGELLKARDAGYITQKEYNLLFQAMEAAMDQALEKLLDQPSSVHAAPT